MRSTITAQPINPSYLAEHEIATAAAEQLVFDNIPNVRGVKPGSIDPYDGMAAHLEAGNPDTRVGTAILLKTMPGDKFTISAKHYYSGELENSDITGPGPIVAALTGALMGGGTYAGVPVNELPANLRTVSKLLTNPALPGLISGLQANDDPTVPKAHLNYLFFDDKMQLVGPASGAIQVQAVPNGWGNTGAINIGGQNGMTGPGFLIVYIDNQSIGKDVWFDDVHVEHYTSKVLEEDHYYPFGLTVQLDQNTSVPTKQPYKLTSKELETDFDLNIYNFGARMQDMQLGRWWGIDEKAGDYNSVSPYAYVGNNPVKYLDPNGREWRIGYFEIGRRGPELKASAIYRQGELYNTDGSKYTGNNSYILTVQNDLRSLREQNAITAGNIDTLISNNYRIPNTIL